MITFHIITIFPEIFQNNSYFDYSILKRAQEKKLIRIKAHNLRDYTEDKHHKVDDRPYGGGPGMALKVAPIYTAVQFLKSKCAMPSPRLRALTGKRNATAKNVRTILFSTRGKKLDEKTAERLARYNNLILICGRYEGVDERVALHIADEEISIGDFVLAGGELPAMVLIESVSRFVGGVLGKTASLESVKGAYPVYTRPEILRAKSEKRKAKHKTSRWTVPTILLSGNHKKIDEWRRRHKDRGS